MPTVKIGRLLFDARYVRLVERSFPGVVWYVPPMPQNFNPAHAVLDGETVALVQPRAA